MSRLKVDDDNLLVGEFCSLELDEPRGQVVDGSHFALGLEHSIVPNLFEHAVTARVDDSQIVVTDISKTYVCNLARYVRKRLQSLGVKKGLKVVFSPEKADQDKIIVTEKAFPKKSIIGTLSYMPAMFGCTVASVVIRDLMTID